MNALRLALGARGCPWWVRHAMHVVGCGRHAAMRGACRSIWQFDTSCCHLLQEAGKSNVIAVINPNSGPDFTGGDATVKCLPHLKQAGNTLIGYVATGNKLTRHKHGVQPALQGHLLYVVPDQMNPRRHSI
jgi:hypothetical protein